MNKFKINQAQDRLVTALTSDEAKARACIGDAIALLSTVDEYTNSLKRKVFIVNLKLHDMSGKLSCQVVDAKDHSETILTGDLGYCLGVARERNYEVVEALTVLEFIVKHFSFKRTGGMKF